MSDRLDILKRIKKLDHQDMGAAIQDCPQQIVRLLDATGAWKPRATEQAPKQVLYMGMGGSAIGGDMARVWVERQSKVPMWVQRGYDVPEWVGPGTLAVASSYSGNTEETLSAVEQAAERGASVIAVASGGELLEQAEGQGWKVIKLPGGLQPRAAIGYSLAAIGQVLVAHDVLPESTLDELRAGASQMAAEGMRWADPGDATNQPLQLAGLIGDRLPVIYGSSGSTEALAIRLRGQLAENSKLLASHHLLPEQNHNEIVGVAARVRERHDLLIFWLTDTDDHPRVQLRRSLAGGLMGIAPSDAAQPPQQVTMSGTGSSLIQRNLSLLHQIDWLSYYAALIRGWDPSAIDVLTELKIQLGTPGQE